MFLAESWWITFKTDTILTNKSPNRIQNHNKIPPHGNGCCLGLVTLNECHTQVVSFILCIEPSHLVWSRTSGMVWWTGWPLTVPKEPKKLSNSFSVKSLSDCRKWIRLVFVFVYFGLNELVGSLQSKIIIYKWLFIYGFDFGKYI